MQLREFYEGVPKAYQDVEQDNSQPRLGQLRQTKLTLRQINRLRQLNDIRRAEMQEKIQKIQKQYSPPPQPAL